MMMKTEKYESLLSDYAYMSVKDGKAGMWWTCNSICVMIVTQEDGFDSGEDLLGY